MHRATAVSERFVEPTPKYHRAKERGHRMRMFAATAIKAACIRNPGRSLLISFGLKAIERPVHNPSSHLTQQRAEFTFKGHGGLRCRLSVDKLINEPSAPGQRARKLHDEGRKCRCQQGLGWRRMDH